ncbi:MAG TPA: ABC transporter substrate-binding protein [Methanomicrobiales archaeon]|nr:ABC transporter substrate-binding protein [Methanomicrobiales archaeon]
MKPGEDMLRIGHLSTLYHTSFLLKGTRILEEKGIRASWRLFPSGPDLVKAMETGGLDLGYLGLPPVIIGIDRGIPLRCIAGGHIEGTVMVAGKTVHPLVDCPGMREFLAQFAGRVIGTPPGGSIHDVIVRELLREHGFTDVRVKNYPWADFLVDALREGEIAAAAGTPALAVASRRYGDAGLVVPPDRLWPFNPSYGIVVMESMLTREGLLRGFLAAHEEASELIRRDPRSAAATVAGMTGMVDPEFVLEAYRISPGYCASLPPEYITSTMKFVGTLRDLGYISRSPGREEIFETELIEKVHPGPHHYRAGISSE